MRVQENLPADLADFVGLAFATGMRRGEIFGLHWSNIQDGDSVIRLSAAQCKNRTGRAIPIRGEIAKIIARRRQAQAFEAKDGTTALSKLVFHRGRGEPVRDFRKIWVPACEKAKTPGLLLHDLRRSAVTAMVGAGVPMLVAMAISGHKTSRCSKDTRFRFWMSSGSTVRNELGQFSDNHSFRLECSLLTDRF